MPVLSYLRLLEPGLFSIFACAVLTNYYGAYRSLSTLKWLASNSLISPDLRSEIEEGSNLRWWHAVIAPCSGSIILLLLFFYYKAIAIVLLIIVCIQGVACFVYVFEPFFHSMSQSEKFACLSRSVGFGQRKVQWHSLLNLFCGVCLVVVWLVTGSWPLCNAIALTMAVAILSFVRFPNAKVSTILLLVFFFYDIFWVFLSPYLFGKSVMVAVATQASMSLPILILFPHIFTTGFTMLGLGDIVLPGLLLTYLLRLDHHNSQTGRTSHYFPLALGLYVVGLMLAMIAVIGMNRGQPALLYLVPCTLGAAFFEGWRRGELHQLWHGPPPLVEEEIGDPLEIVHKN
jgi:hypothetical protein